LHSLRIPAVIALVTEFGGVARTKHLWVRMELCREALQQKQIMIQYVHMLKMIVDGLIKALDGKLFWILQEIC